MTYEWKVKLPISNLPFLARTELDQWIEIGFDLNTTKVTDEPKPWTGDDEQATVYTTMFTSKEGWREEEVPFWMVDIFNDFCAEFADENGKLQCRYRRVQRANVDGKLTLDGKMRMDNHAELMGRE